ncbi:unnamed protein product [Rotaria sp. Silwood2]|nr:unnamed protein product [Rotaria sp. Silwood2]CAF3137542.1 unnamed protein product [Rotaria sp. Silwood2]CAF3290918.1 unnamed protein product [Rotaria sp. Silwood2]CAF4184694.1 unnamed protein product [Rotaria sp. Silwood2]CAF4209899.1 unnamed protein product [Rotaria sp. Silwood2]
MAWLAAAIPIIPMAIEAITKLINGKDADDKPESVPQKDSAAEERNNTLETRNRELTEQMERSQIEQQKRNEELAAQNKQLREDIEKYQKEHEKQLKQMTKLLAELKEKKLNSFEAIEEHDKKAKEALIRLAKEAQPIGMKGNNVALFGLTSTGKSTMLNSLLGEKKAATGVGETTLEVASYSGRNFVLWDIPGRNDEVSYMSMQYISFFKGLTRRLILVQHTIKENSSIMKLLDAIDIKYDIIVNKMDRVEEEERTEFCEQIRKEIQKIGLKGVGRVFFVSAKYPAQFPDWLEMVNYLTNSSN